MSPLFHAMNGERPLISCNQHLIGDSAYPLLFNLMTPFRDNDHLTRSQSIYNIKLSSIRSIIERNFGLLKTKFRRLKYLDINDFDFGMKMIAAACTLHNFIIQGDELNVQEDYLPNKQFARKLPANLIKTWQQIGINYVRNTLAIAIHCHRHLQRQLQGVRRLSCPESTGNPGAAALSRPDYPVRQRLGDTLLQ